MNPAAYAVVDHSALRHNLGIVRQYAPDAKVMAVIKADGYGHGLIRVAMELDGADAFAVARVEEGIRLRQEGVKQRIAVLEGFVYLEELELLHRFQLEPVIHSQDQLDLLETIPSHGYIHGWLKLDTGMHRLGFDVAEIDKITNRIDRCRGIAKPIPLMTHLANADDVNDPATARQIEWFNRATAGIPAQRSIANSAAILEWDASMSDWVRPGIMLFGVSPFPDQPARKYRLRPVMTLYSRLLAVKNLRFGDAVGYGGEWRCAKPIKLGIIAIGYGDGYPRQATTGTPVLVNGNRVTLVGRVSMDMITVDLSNDPDAKAGDPVVLWGENLPVEEIARHASTIPYTLLCGITQRVMIVD